jgi:N6-L-threonylcarbamoyladenine synthase
VVCLIVSGGHTELILMTGHGQYRLLGKTIDDAAGEAFDKAARILGLGYPGGPAVQKAAEGGNPNHFHFPRALLKGTLDFSFSGLKTALLRKVEEYGISASKPAPWQRDSEPPPIAPPQKAVAERPASPVETTGDDEAPRAGERQVRPVPKAASVAGNAAEVSRSEPPQVSSFTSEPHQEELFKVSPPPRAQAAPPAPRPVPPPAPEQPDASSRPPLPVADLAASFQAAVVDVLVEKTATAAAEYGAREVLVAGGVAANSLLREKLGERLTMPFRYPPLVLCTDNAAMIAAAAYYRYADARQYDFAFDIEPSARLF